jgi:uncharacterized protein YkwD
MISLPGTLLGSLAMATLLSCGPAVPDTAEPGATSTQWEDSSGGQEQSDAPLATEVPSDDSGDAPPARGSNLGAREQAILNRHNQHRADHCAPPLQWSAELAAVAQSWANQLKQAGCAFEHSQQSRYGENLSFFAPVGSSTPDEVVTGWYSEVSDYDFSNGSFGMDTGHFTQVVWRGTQAVGCGQSQCNGGELWVCNYNPPGNMSGSFDQNVRPKGCSDK